MTTRYVVDTGVLLRWYVPQVGHEHALAVQKEFLAGDVTLTTPQSTRYELPHVLRTKGLLGRRLTTVEYVSASTLPDDLGIVQPFDFEALRRAAGIAADRHLRFFDAVLVELALYLDQPLLTSDRRILRAVGDLIDVVVLLGVPD